MPTNIDDKELARLEELSRYSVPGDFSSESNDPDMQYIAAACNAVPALVAEVRRLRTEYAYEHAALIRHEQMVADLMDKVEAWEWLFEVIEYDVYEDHPLSSRWGYDMSDKEREAYLNARVSYAHIEDAAREAIC